MQEQIMLTFYKRVRFGGGGGVHQKESTLFAPSIIPFLFTLNMIYLELDVNGAPQYLLNNRVCLAIEDHKFTFPAEKRIVLYK